MKILQMAAAAIAALALVSSGFVSSSATATPNDQQIDAVAWLAAQIPNDTHLFESRYGAGEFDVFVDYGLNLDIQFALRELGQTAKADQVYAAVLPQADEYTDAWGTRYAGSVGKLATYVELKGDDSTALSGRNLTADLAALMSPTGQLMNEPTDGYENNIGQAWGVRALALAGSPAADAAADFLLTQQCSDGGFRETPGAGACTSSVDATVFAVEALDDAGRDTAVGEAIAWLSAQQSADGSFADAGNPNSNSAGLAGVVFAANGESAAAEKAAIWIAGLQLTSGPDAGAIASTASDHSAQGAGAIDALDQDKWVRATFQAALALDSLAEVSAPGAVDSLVLSVSDTNPTQGDTITVVAEGKDAEGRSTGDVTDEIELSSSVETDTIDGNSVTFNHASPHVITAVHVPTSTTATITVEVAAAASGGGAVGDGSASAGAADGSSGVLPAAGSPVDVWQAGVAALLVMLGIALVVVGRERRFLAVPQRSGTDH